MKNILLLIHDDEGQEARYQVALDVTRATGGHLICVDLTAIPEFTDDYGGTVAVMMAREMEVEAANRARMIARLEHEDVSFEWIDRTGFAAQAIRDHAGLTDLIVLSTDWAGELCPHLADVVGDALVRLGKPVLVVPAKARRLDVANRAMMAWDGSENAQAALQASVPLLSLARTVTLFHVDDGGQGLPAEAAARYLSRHGIEPVVQHEPATVDRPGNALLTEIGRGQHDWLVMGAFGHSRTIEAMFGGTTRTMLEHSPVPILMAHRR